MVNAASTGKQIVTSIAALAGHLGFKTIAEFVVIGNIMSEVRGVSINYAQGYYFAKPSPNLS
jgi:EAL domain-containing protein (putative c-di-GMP-specific phosphodiesterase class I)